MFELWIGEHKSPLKKNRKEDNVMDTAFNYYFDDVPSLSYISKRLFLDSGAYSAMRRNIELTPERVLDVQESLDPDLAVVLDYPFASGYSTSLMQRLWKKTLENLKLWQESSTLKEVVPVLHAWSFSSLEKNLMDLIKISDSDVVLLGSIVTEDISSSKAFFGDRQLNKNIIVALYSSVEFIRKESNYKIHLTGFGSSPLTLHLAYYMGVESVDTAGQRRKAAYGKIVLPGTGEIYVSGRKAKFGRTVIKKNQKKLLEYCECPICSTNPELIYSDWRARAIHNEYVLKKEHQKARILMEEGEDVYEKYLDFLFANSGFRHIWRYLKRLKHYKRLDQLIR